MLGNQRRNVLIISSANKDTKIKCNMKDLTWQQLCRIVETAFHMVGRNINDDLMCGYDSPQEFYEELKEKLK